ncbi:MAG: PIN domain-containing protein [bacterium]|nr:PIN domain-containing protein [bacterium]
MKILVDSSVYVSAFLNDEKRSSISWDFCMILKNDPSLEIVGFRLVILEVLNVLLRRNDSVTARYVSRFYARAVSGEVEDIGLAPQRLVFEASKKVKLKTSDLLVLLKAYEKGAMLISWDEQLVREGKKLMPCLTPREFLDELS